MSITLKTLGLLAFVAATMLMRWTGSEEPASPISIEEKLDAIHPLAGLLPFCLGLVVYIPAAALVYLGYRLGLRPADEVLRKQQGPLAIYLRSFADDGRNNLNPTGRLPTWLGIEAIDYLRPLGPLANANPIRLLRLLLSNNADTAEEQLSQFFRKQGPFIAIGRPGELLAPGGAARAYVTDDQWQDRVKEWLIKADTVLLQPADTRGVWWEIEEVLRTVAKEKLLFCLVNFQGNQHGYEKFASRFQQITGVRMPRYLGNRCFLWLEGDHACFAAPVLRWPMTWPASGCAVDFKRTLHRFLTHQNQEASEIRPRRYTLLWDVNAILAVVLWMILAFLPGCLINVAFAPALARQKAQPSTTSIMGAPQQWYFAEETAKFPPPAN